MTPDERASLAEQLLSNPLWDDLFDGMESDAVEQMIFANNEELRADLAKRVQAIRSLRADCEAMLRNTHERKAAPA